MLSNERILIGNANTTRCRVNKFEWRLTLDTSRTVGAPRMAGIDSHFNEVSDHPRVERLIGPASIVRFAKK